MAHLNFVVQKAFLISHSGGNCSSPRRKTGSSRVLGLLPLGIREAQGDPWEPRACRAPSLPPPFSLPFSRPDRSLFLSLPRSPHAFRYTRRPAWTPAIRLTVEEMRTQARRGSIFGMIFLTLRRYDLWVIYYARTVSAMKYALHCARLNQNLFCESYWHFLTHSKQNSLSFEIDYKII